MKRGLLATLLFLVAVTSPAQAEEKNDLVLTQYAVNGTSVALGFSTTTAGDTLRVTVDPTSVSARSRLNDSSPILGRSFTATLRSQDSDGANRVEITFSLPELKEIGAHRALAEIVSGSRTLARTTFFISSLSSKAAKRTPITWLWPITDRPHRGLDNIFFDDQLATDLGPSGRLTRLVRAAADHNVVWVLDPELLASIEQMSLGYQVRRGDELVSGSGSDLASTWLEQLRLATASRDVIALPYADPDLATVNPVDLGALRNYALLTVSRILNRSDFTVASNVGLTSDGAINEAMPRTLNKSGFTALVMSSDAFTNEVTFTRPAMAAINSGVQLVVADSKITQALASGDSQGANRALAEIATITAERPADPRIQLLQPPRTWNPSEDALRIVLAGLRNSEQGWTHLRNQVPGEWPTPQLSAMPYSATFTDALASMLAKVARTQAVLGSDYEPSLDRAMRAYTAINSNFRTNKSTLITQLDRSASAYVNNLRILPGRYVLTGKEQSIPLTIVNGFDRPVRISVDLRPHAPRVVIRGTSTVEIPANGRTQLQVPVTSVAAGLVAVDAYIVSSDGQQYGDGAVLNLDVRNIGPVGNWILYGSVALLALAVGLRLTRQMRSRRNPS